jgi:hypothetical protein
MIHTRRHSRRFMRTLIPVAVCAVLALSLTGVAFASGSTNYGNFNPLTGQPYSITHSTKADLNAVPVTPIEEPAASTVTPVVQDHGDQALALSLAGTALLVALAGTGYTVVRISRLPRPAGSR